MRMISMLIFSSLALCSIAGCKSAKKESVSTVTHEGSKAEVTRTAQVNETRPDVTRVESRDGAEAVPDGSGLTAKGVRHHTGRQVCRLDRSRTSLVRQVHRSAD